MLKRLALILGVWSLMSTTAFAAACLALPQSNDCAPMFVLVDPTTGLPYAASGSGSGGTVNLGNLNGAATDGQSQAIAAATQGILAAVTATGAIATNQISVAAAATPVIAARAQRTAVTIVNHGTTDVFLGGSGVTTTTGTLLPGTKGASITLQTNAAVYGVVGTGTQTVSFFEAY